ncbi:penicillin-binding protein, partial [Ruminococcaceae bacterium OttesenSCG-928-I18]|nr:penicillin-binding protein [Ruminococcaceae bacterium OttesenSCG-928-I18]
MKKDAKGSKPKKTDPALRSYERPPATRGRGQAGKETQKIEPAKPAPSVSSPSSPAKGKKPKSGKAAIRPRSRIGKVFRTFFFLLFLCVVAFGFYLAVIIAKDTIDDDIILNLDDLKTPQTSYIMAQNESGEWIEYQKLSREQDSTWVELGEMSPYVIDAAIATEDRDFYNHGGIAVTRTIYAALNEVFAFEDTFGASTIDQQLVKNLTGDKEVADEEGNKSVGYRRKVVEIWRALGLNIRYSKDTILEAYLNTMPLSGTIAGVQAGAREYFNKTAAQLTLPEAALIAGITQAPAQYNPYNNPEAAKTRRDNVLYFMLENGNIGQEEYEAAVATPIDLYMGPRQYDINAQVTGVTSYFSDTVFEAVVNDLVAQGVVASREAAITYYYTGGLRIYATVDLRLQDEMERVYEQGWDEDGLFPASVYVVDEETGEEVHPQSAMAVVRHDGSLAGVVGGLGKKQESLGLNRATQSPRSIGSSMKPLAAYALGIDSGIINYSSPVADTYVDEEEKWPVNYGPTNPTGRNVLVCDALAQSLNTVAAHIGEDVGIQNMYDFLSGPLEISTMVGEGAVNDLGLSSLVLGGMTNGITAAELAAAYTMYGGGEGYGVHTTLHSYTEVRDSDGNTVLAPEVNTIQAVKPSTGYIMNRLMRNVLTNSGGVSGTASGMALQTTDSVGKTGTTSDDKDRWFVGVTPEYISAVWWGYDTNEPIQWSPSAYTNPPVNVWKTVMDTVQEGTENTEFADPPETVVQRGFVRGTGQLIAGGYNGGQTGWYDVEQLDNAG